MISRCLIGAAAAIVCVLFLVPVVQAGASQVGPVSVPSAPSSFGDAHAPFASSLEPNAPLVGMAATPNGQGYWLVGADGGIFTFGDAGYFGSMGGKPLNQPIVGMAATPNGQGYWLVGADGGIFTFGDAGYFGSMGGKPLNQPIVGMAATPNGQGYWLVGADGGIFAFGDAGYLGSMGGKPLNQPIVGMAATPNGQGYWLVASDGGIFAFGDASFEGSLGGRRLSAPIVSMAAVPGSMGYWLVGSDGGVFAFGTAHYDGSLGGQSLGYPITDIVATPTGGGYWLLPTSLVTKGLGHMVLPLASAPSVPAVCSQSLAFGQDGTFEPLTCGGDTAVNVVAWDNAAPISPSMLSLGPLATPNVVLAAFCTDLPHSTIPIEIQSYTLASTYYGWQFTIPGTTFVGANC